MDSDQWSEVRTHFSAARDLPSTEREAFLRSLSPILRGQVMDLLQADENAADFLEQPDPWLAPGTVMGSYRLEGLIARGGMGEVYQASHLAEPERKAAIKVLGPVFMFRDAERRFASEQRILCQLSHPNIVEFYECGEYNGRQYLAMEWVEGLGIDEWAKGVLLEERLRMFMEVCSAVHVAHQSLVVHRDLKPSNILVTPEGRPKLLDFGISRLLEPAGGAPTSTRTALPIMSLPYCSPEQALNQPVGIPSDIYSLGLLLFEFASGRPAQDVSDLPLDRALEKIAHGELPRAEDIPRDLHAIASKASDKDPQRRYASALELGEDVRRFLSGYPVLARPTTLRYAVGKYYRRHRAAVLAGAAGLLLAAGAFGGLVIQYHRAQAERQKAERRYEAVRQLAQVMLFDAPTRIAAIPGTIDARRWMVERALSYLEQMSAGAEGDAAFALTVAKGYRQVAFQQYNFNAPNLNDPRAALKTLEKGMAVLETIREENEALLLEKVENLLARPYSPLNDRKAELANEDAMDGLLTILDVMGSSATRDLKPRMWFKKAVNMGRSEEERLALWGKLETYYAGRLGEKPDDPDRIRNLALMHKNVSGLHSFRRDYSMALKHDREAVRLDEMRLALMAKDRNVQMDYTFSLGRLGEDLCLAGRREEGIPYLRKAVEIRREAVKSEPEDNRARERLAWMLGELGQQVALNGDAEEGERLVLEALEIRKQLHAPGFGENSEPDLHRILAHLAGRRGDRRRACREWRLAQASVPSRGTTEAALRVIGAEEIRAEAAKCGGERGRP